MSDVNQSPTEPSQGDSPREPSNSQMDTDNLHENPEVLKLIDSFSSPQDDFDNVVVQIGTDEVPPHNAEPEGSEPADPEPKEEPASADEPEEPAAAGEVKPPAASEDIDDDSYPTDEEVEQQTPNSQKRIRQLVSARKRTEERLVKAEEDASYKRELDETLAKVGSSPESWDQWTNLGFRLQSNDPSVPAQLRQMADNLDGGTAQPAPAGTTAIDADLQAQVDSLDMSEGAAEKVQAERRTRAQPAPSQTPDANTGPSLHKNAEALQAQGTAAVAAVNDEYAKLYPGEWPKLISEVEKEMAKYAGTPPHLWGQLARDAAEKVVARKKGKLASKPDPTLRGGGSRPKTPGSGKATKESFVDSMLSGELFKQ